MLQGSEVNKKFLIRNPEGYAKQLRLFSQNDWLLTPKGKELEVPAQGSSYIRVRLSARRCDKGKR